MSKGQPEKQDTKTRMRPNIRISHALNGRVKDYAAERGINVDEAYREIISTGLEQLEERDATPETKGEAERAHVDADGVDIEAEVDTANWSDTNYARTPSRVQALVRAFEHLRENTTATTPELVSILDEQLGEESNNQRLLSDVSKQLEIVESPPSGSNKYRWAGRD